MSLIETVRLILRPPQHADAAGLVRIANDLAVARWLTRMPHPYSLRDAEAFIDANAGNAGSVWLIEDLSGPVGMIGMEREFGYWLARSVWGRGYATEAGRAVLATHFRQPDAAPVLASHFIGNDASRRVLDKLGFVKTGSGQVWCRARAADVTAIEMRLSRADWTRSQRDA